MANFKRRYKPEMEVFAQAAPRRGQPKTPAAARPANPGAQHTAPASTTPATPTHSGAAPRRNQTPAKPSGGGGYYAPPAIKKMQEAMQNLAKLISATINYESLGKAMSEPATADKKQFSKSYGRDAFSNFMVNSYLRNSSVKGVEYDTDPKKSKMSAKAPSDLKYMFTVLDSLKRIGAEPKESFADGTWGPRTNNALRNVSAIADSIMKLGKDLGMESTSYDPNKIAELHTLIPEKDTDISMQEKIQRAPKLAEILTGVSSLFTDFKGQVLENPNYAVFINGESPIFKEGPAKEKKFEPSQAEAGIYQDLQTNFMNSRYAQHDAAKFNVTIPKELIPVQYGQMTIKPFQITGGDLVTDQAFKNWVNRNSVLMDIQKGNPTSWNAVVKTVLDQVKQQVDQKLSAPTPQAPTQQTPLQTTR